MTTIIVIGAAVTLGMSLVLNPARPLVKGYPLAAIVVYLIGLCLMGFYALGVENIVYLQASRESCAQLMGIPIAEAGVRSDFAIHTEFYPPSVSCSFGSETRVLTSPSRSDSWAQYWAGGHALVLLSPLLGLWGLGWARLDKRRANQVRARTEGSSSSEH